MLSNLLIVAQNVATLFLLIAVGAGCQRTRLLSDGAVKALADLVLYIATPCVIIKSCIRPFDAAMLRGFLLVLLIAALQHALLIAVAHAVFRDRDAGRRLIYRFATVFSNAGYMALPLQQAILPENGVFYCAAYVIVFNLFAWTYGVTAMSGDRRQLSARRLATNPGILGVLAGLLIFGLSIPIPPLLGDAIGHMAALNTPLPMVIVGYYLAKTDLAAALKDRRSYLCLLLRLVVAPLAALGLLLLGGVRGELLVSLMICISTPVATITTMFATRYDRDSALSVNLVSVSTLFSIVTMPVWIALAQSLGT